MQSDYLGYAIAFVTFAVGLAVSYYFYKKSIRVREPVYSIKNNRLVSSDEIIFPNLKMSYKNKKIENFSVGKILFFNRGAETITKDDIDTVNHLKIVVKNDAKILDASILQMNNPSSQFTLEIEEHEVLINFEYINKNQGAAIQLLHTGNLDDIEIVGDIKHVNKIVVIEGKSKINIAVKKLMINNWTIIFMALMTSGITIFTVLLTILDIIIPEEARRFMASLNQPFTYPYDLFSLVIADLLFLTLTFVTITEIRSNFGMKPIINYPSGLE